MVRILSGVMMAALVVALVAGCATVKGPSPEEQIKQTISDWTAATVAKDVDKMMTFVDEDFSSSEWPDKDAYKTFVADSVEMGYLDDLEVSTENAKITFEGEDKATVYPIDITAQFGTATLNVVLEEEDGKWLISDVTMDM